MQSQLCLAQSLLPSVINASGGAHPVTGTDGPVTIYYSIGETIIEDVTTTNSHERFTQGFLQPEVIGTGVLIVESYSTAMTCYSSNDAAIVVNAKGTNAPFTYTWFKNGTQLADTGSTILNLNVGNYSFTVKDKRGNTRAANVEIVNGAGACKLIIHNGLSPNDDGHNDFFHIEHIIDYPSNRVEIYNRWGDAIWAGSRYDNINVLWKGEDKNGVALPAGTYYYVVEIDGNKTTGWIELMR